MDTRLFGALVAFWAGFAAQPLLAANSHSIDLKKEHAQYLSAAHSSSLTLTGNLTVEMWANFRSLPAPSNSIPLFRKWGSTNGTRAFQAILLNDSGAYKLYFWASNTGNDVGVFTINLGFTPVVGEWHHYAVTYRTTGVIELIVDGVSRGTATTPVTSLFPVTERFEVGANATDRLDGFVDDIRIWSVARDVSQIAAQRSLELLGSEPGLRAYWRLNNSLADATSNGNSLTFRDAGLKAVYHLEDGTDASGNGYHLDPEGTVAYVGGRFGNAANFGATNSSNRVFRADDFGGSLYSGSSTWSVWFKPLSHPSLNSQFTILGMATYPGGVERDYLINYLDRGGTKVVEWRRGNYGGLDEVVETTTPLTSGTWYHLALVYDDGPKTLKGYLNGALIGTVPADHSGSSAASNPHFSVGSWVTPTHYTSGHIDEIVVMGRALSAPEIAQLVNSPFSPGAFSFTNSIPFDATVSISGNISGAGAPNGPVRVSAERSVGGEVVSVVVPSLGPYMLTGLSPGGTYLISAFLDQNSNGTLEGTEWRGTFPGNPVVATGGPANINIILFDPTADTDHDGMPDGWEMENGLTVGIHDADLDLDGDGLTNIQEYYLGTKANNPDTDGDGLTDGAEVLLHGTDPLFADTDGDGIPDGWEVANGLDPRRDDANEDRDFDFVSNRDEYNGGVNSTKANSPDSDGDGVSDYVQRQGGKSTWRALYDRNDRLLGVCDARGATFCYRYDGNGNIIGQAKLGFDSDGDGLSDLWEYAHGLDASSASGSNGASGDADGDGWTNLQEQLAGSDPNDPNSTPGANGRVVGALALPFVPTNFISAAGQLDGAGNEELVVGGDGDPGIQDNFIRIFTEQGGSWRSEAINVGPYGVTSAALGRLPDRPPGIYLGLRKVGGRGRIVEIARSAAGVWQAPTLVSESISEAAFVHGIRSTTRTTDLLLGFAPRIGIDGALYRAAYQNGGWVISYLNSSLSHRGPGVLLKPIVATESDRFARLLDGGAIQLVDEQSFPSVDEFNDTLLDPRWIPTNTASAGGTANVPSESAGSAHLSVVWTNSTASTALARIETTVAWPSPVAALTISIPQIRHFGNNPNASGSAAISAGASLLYSVARNTTQSGTANVLIQMLRVDATIYFRTNPDNAGWSAWSECPFSDNLRFQVNGTRSGSGGSGNAAMDIDSVRFTTVSDLLAPVTTNGFATANAYFRTSSRVWYFKQPPSASWVAAQLYAGERTGNLVTVDSIALATELAAQFSSGWIGYQRDPSTAPWRWVSGSAASFTNWAASNPAAGSDQLFAQMAGATWLSSNGTGPAAGIYELTGQAIGALAFAQPEPNAIQRLQPPGRNLIAGRFNAANQAEPSLIEAFIEDTPPLGAVNAGDRLVVAELGVGASSLAQRSLSERVLSASGLSATYGLAAFRNRAGTQDYLMTGENDGEVFAWIPAAPGSVLARKTLSTAHRGKAWHALQRVVLAGDVDGVAGLRVSTGTPNTTEVVFWSPAELGFTAPPIIQQSAPVAQVLAVPSAGFTHATVGLRVWDSEENASRVSLQFQSPPGTGAWADATLLSIAGQPAASAPQLAAPVAGATYALVWNAGLDLGPSFNAGVLLRTRATDFAAAGAWSAAMHYRVDTTQDSDGDGLPNAWEQSNGLNPLLADSLTDSDGDGIPALLEFALGLDPRAASSLGLPVASIEGGYLTLTVTRNAAAAQLTFAIEVSSDFATWTDGAPAITILESTPTILKVRANTPAASGGIRGMRLRVTAP